MNIYTASPKEISDNAAVIDIPVVPYGEVKERLDKAARDTHKKLKGVFEEIMRFSDDSE